MKTEKHDWEDNSAVLVNITAPHPEYSVRRLRRRKSWKRKLNLLGMAVPDVVMVPGQGVVTTASDGAGHHAARVQLQLGLQTGIMSINYTYEFSLYSVIFSSVKLGLSCPLFLRSMKKSM